MSDAWTDLMRDSQNQNNYDKRLQFIKEYPLEQLAQFYNIEISNDILQFKNMKDFTLERIGIWDFDKGVENEEFKLTIRIPFANMWCESFQYKSFQEITTRCLAYLQWANTDLGKKAIKNYLK